MPDGSSSSEQGTVRSALRRRDWLVAIAAAAMVSIALNLGFGNRLSGTSIDLLFWLRYRLFGALHERDASPAVIVAIDEETYRTPPFVDIPNALWTQEIAKVLDALVAADAKVVGFDAIFPASIERFVPGFDRPFLVSLRKAARLDKVVLGEAQHQRYPIHPFPAQSFAVENERNIRSVNLFSDDDGIIRRIPLTLERENAGGGSRNEPSMALELAARAEGVEPKAGSHGVLSLGGYAVPGSRRDAMLVNFDGGDDIPSYSLADLQACAAQGNAAYFREHFAGKVVLIGAVLDVEDRKLTSKRLITAPDAPSTGVRCAHQPMSGLFRGDLVRDTIPGVYILATAVDNLLRRDALGEFSPLAETGFVALLALAIALATMRLRPPAAGGALVLGTALWAGVALLAFREDLVLPLLAPPLAAGITAALLLGYRFAVTDREKRVLKSSFGLYLAPALVERMIESDRLPELGGELRNVTVLFSDIAGFTGISERHTPHELVALMNEYLTMMTDIIEAEGGFVDKYVGDAITAVFGAPLDDPAHALHAVRAALGCRDRLDELERLGGAFQGERMRARIGVSTGDALVGNIGSRRRFNYTAMGDIVNLAARLEGANKIYGTAVLAAESTRRAAGDAIDWREIDRVRVMGRGEAVSIFEPLAIAGATSPETSRLSAAFAAALAEYRAGRFEAAAQRFQALAAADAPARLFAARAKAWLGLAPPQPWDAVTTLETK